MNKKQRKELRSLFNSYNMNKEEYKWYRKIYNETSPKKKLSIESCIEIQKRGGPDAIHLRPDLFPVSSAMSLLLEAFNNEDGNHVKVFNALSHMIKEDYPEVFKNGTKQKDNSTTTGSSS